MRPPPFNVMDFTRTWRDWLHEVYDILWGGRRYAKTLEVSAAHSAGQEGVILCDATSGAFTVTLPLAKDSSRVMYYIKKIDSSGNAITVDGNGSETIDGATTKSLASQYDRIQIVCDGTAWHVID